MARRPGDQGRFSLSPRERRIAGWVAAAVLVGGIALVVGILGGNGDGTAVVPTPPASTSAPPEPDAIAFGTAIDPVTGEVSADATVATFGPGDPFAYSVRPAEPPSSPIYVEVRRTSGGPAETVQPPSPQSLADGAQIIAFVVVDSAALVEAFGTGEFTMLIYTNPTDAPIAEGDFALVEGTPAASTAPTPSRPAPTGD